MNRKQIMDVAVVPTLALLALYLISAVVEILPSSSYTLLLPIGLIMLLLPMAIYLYTGYYAVKKYNLGLGEAFVIGASMSALITLVATLISLEIGMYTGGIYKTQPTTIIFSMLIGIVAGGLFNGFLAVVGGAFAQPNTPESKMTKTELLVFVAAVVLIIFAGIIILFYIGGPSPSRVFSQCMFQTAGISCISSKLSTNSELTLTIGQGTGHTIRINGVACTLNTSPDYIQSNIIIYNPPLATNITMNPGTTAVIADPTSSNGGVATVKCTQADNIALESQTIGDAYTNGRIYVNYTETDTNVTRIATAVYSARYEA